MAETAAEAAYRAALDEIERVKRAGHRVLRLDGKSFHGLDQIPPELTEIAGLEELHLAGTAVSDLAPVAELVELNVLYLGRTAVSDLTPLVGLTELNVLDLTLTAVVDIAPLASLADLYILDLARTDVFDITPLAGLADLNSLDLAETRIVDLTAVERLIGLETLSLAKTAVSDLAPLAALNMLETLNLAETPIFDLNPIASLTLIDTLDLSLSSVSDLSPLMRLTALSRLRLQGSRAADLRPIRRLVRLGRTSEAGLVFADTPATRLDAELARMAEIEDNRERVRQTLAYLDSLPPWPEPYTPKARPDGLPPEPIGGLVEPSPPVVQTAEAQMRALLRNALVTRVSAAAFAEQIAEALRGVPATNGNELAPALQLMAEVGEVLGAIGRQSADAQHEENLLRLRISQLESLVDRLTVQLKDAEEARKAAEALAQKDGFMRSYRKSLGIAAGAGTVTLVGVGVPTAAVYFLGAEHELVKAFLTVLGRLPKS